MLPFQPTAWEQASKSDSPCQEPSAPLVATPLVLQRQMIGTNYKTPWNLRLSFHSALSNINLLSSLQTLARADTPDPFLLFWAPPTHTHAHLADPHTHSLPTRTRAGSCAWSHSPRHRVHPVLHPACSMLYVMYWVVCICLFYMSICSTNICQFPYHVHLCCFYVRCLPFVHVLNAVFVFSWHLLARSSL